MQWKVALQVTRPRTEKSLNCKSSGKMEHEPHQHVAHTFRVRYAETDAMGIVHHGSYVDWMEMGRTEFMRAFSFTYRQLEEMGVLLPVLEINVRYKAAAVYDDELRITTWVEELTRVRVKLAYKI